MKSEDLKYPSAKFLPKSCNADQGLTYLLIEVLTELIDRAKSGHEVIENKKLSSYVQRFDKIFRHSHGEE